MPCTPTGSPWDGTPVPVHPHRASVDRKPSHVSPDTGPPGSPSSPGSSRPRPRATRPGIPAIPWLSRLLRAGFPLQGRCPPHAGTGSPVTPTRVAVHAIALGFIGRRVPVDPHGVPGHPDPRPPSSSPRPRRPRTRPRRSGKRAPSRNRPEDLSISCNETASRAASLLGGAESPRSPRRDNRPEAASTSRPKTTPRTALSQGPREGRAPVHERGSLRLAPRLLSSLRFFSSRTTSRTTDGGQATHGGSPLPSASKGTLQNWLPRTTSPRSRRLTPR